MASIACKACAADDIQMLEAIGNKALWGALSWRAAAGQAGVRPDTLKNHMEKHVVLEAVREAQAAEADRLDEMIAEARAGLEQQFYLAADDVKPLVLVAIQNLEGLRLTKPSQETLIKALKTIQEMTGMKNEQRLMLEYANKMFGQKPIEVNSTNTPVRAIEA